MSVSCLMNRTGWISDIIVPVCTETRVIRLKMMMGGFFSQEPILPRTFKFKEKRFSSVSLDESISNKSTPKTEEQRSHDSHQKITEKIVHIQSSVKTQKGKISKHYKWPYANGKSYQPLFNFF